MEPLLSQLKANLHAQAQLHGELCDALEHEVAGDGRLEADALIKMQVHKADTARRLQELEGDRMRLVETLAAEWGEAAGTLTLRRIIPRAGAALGPELEACHAELQARVGRVAELAGITARNAQARLKAIDATLAFIGEAIRLYPTYSEAGRLHKITPTLKYTSA